MIKRFREGRPTSRTEREKERQDGKVNEMWWLPPSNNNNNREGPKIENNYEPQYQHRYPGRDNNYNRDIDIPDDDRPQTRGDRDRRPMGGAMKSRNDHLRSLDLGSSWGSLGEEFMSSTGRDIVDRDVGRGIRVGTKGDTDKSKWFEKRPGQMQEPNYIDNSNEFQPMWRMRGRDGPGDSLRLDKYKPAGDEFGRQSMEDMLRSSGSTGLKGLLMKELKLDTKNKDGYNKDKKDENKDTYEEYDDYNNYNYKNKNTAEVSATVTSELNDLLKSLQDADQLKMKEYSEKRNNKDGSNNYNDGDQRTSIADVANRLEAEMKGFKILFEDKKGGTFTENSQKERDAQMREAGKLEALSMIDDLIDRGSTGRPPQNPNVRLVPSRNVLQGIDMNVGMVQMAIDKEIMAAKETLQQMYMIKRNLARGLNQADNYQSLDSSRDSRRRDRNRDRDSPRNKEKDKYNNNQENLSYQRKALDDNYRPQSITKISQNIEVTLDEVIASLRKRLIKPPITETDLDYISEMKAVVNEVIPITESKEKRPVDIDEKSIDIKADAFTADIINEAMKKITKA